jgi:hypothetical protein
MICPDCGGEYRIGIERCPDCDVALVAALPAVEEPPPVRRVIVDRFHDLGAAQLAAGALRTAGIEAWLRDTQTLGVDWLLSPAIGGARLEVRAEQELEARALLASRAPVVPADLPPELRPGDPEEEAAYVDGSRSRKRAIGLVGLLLMSPVAFLLGLPLALRSAVGRKPKPDGRAQP